jgi:hypothetical protein
MSVAVAKEWPAPMNLSTLSAMKGIEGFVVTMQNGLMFKVKSNWWKEQQQLIKHLH